MCRTLLHTNSPVAAHSLETKTPPALSKSALSRQSGPVARLLAQRLVQAVLQLHWQRHPAARPRLHVQAHQVLRRHVRRQLPPVLVLVAQALLLEIAKSTDPFEHYTTIASSYTLNTHTHTRARATAYIQIY
jgi:hypothetical protein